MQDRCKGKCHALNEAQRESVHGGMGKHALCKVFGCKKGEEAMAEAQQQLRHNLEVGAIRFGPAGWFASGRQLSNLGGRRRVGFR